MKSSLSLIRDRMIIIQYHDVHRQIQPDTTPVTGIHISYFTTFEWIKTRKFPDATCEFHASPFPIGKDTGNDGPQH